MAFHQPLSQIRHTNPGVGRSRLLSRCLQKRERRADPAGELTFLLLDYLPTNAHQPPMRISMTGTVRAMMRRSSDTDCRRIYSMSKATLRRTSSRHWS